MYTIILDSHNFSLWFTEPLSPCIVHLYPLWHNSSGFRPIPLGVFRGKRKKREEKKDIMRELCKFMENYLNLFLQFKSPFPSVYTLPCQALVPELQPCAVQFFPLSTPWHPLICPHILQGTVHLDSAKYHCCLDNLYSNSNGICIQLAIFIALLLFPFSLHFWPTWKKSETWNHG